MRDALGSVQSVLVLGGGSDIATATVDRLVAGGARDVVLAARHPDQLAETVDRLGRAGARVETAKFDALDVSTHQSLIDEVFDRHDDIDVVLMAFGVLGDQATFDADPQAAAEAVQVNYVGALSAGLAAANRLRAQGHGTLVVMSSVAGERVRKGNFVYGSSKAGIDGFAQGLGDALAGSGVDVLVVRPGFVRTKMTEGAEPAPFATTPEAVADAIVAGLRQRRSVVWVPPLLRWVFAAFRHLPRPLWRIVSARA